MNESRPGWRGGDGELYERTDVRLAGYSNPPCDPAWNRKHPGEGMVLLTQVRLVGEGAKRKEA